MGQHEISKILKERFPEYLTATEIMIITNVNSVSVWRSLKKLCLRNEIEYIVKQGSKKRSGWKKYYRIKEDIENE